MLAAKIRVRIRIHPRTFLYAFALPSGHDDLLRLLLARSAPRSPLLIDALDDQYQPFPQFQAGQKIGQDGNYLAFQPVQVRFQVVPVA
jgi:hypothetical protein